MNAALADVLRDVWLRDWNAKRLGCEVALMRDVTGGPWPEDHPEALIVRPINPTRESRYVFAHLDFTEFFYGTGRLCSSLDRQIHDAVRMFDRENA